MLGALPPGVALPDALTAVAQRLIERLEREAPPGRARQLLTAAFLLTGLRVRREEQAKKYILRLAQKRFGPADEAIKARLNGITDLERLDRLHDRILDSTGWQDLLDMP
jgi:hypothetical protein